MSQNVSANLDKALTALILEVFRFNGRMLAVGDGLGRDLGLTSARWQILSAIEQEPLPVAHVAFNRGLTRQSVQRVVDLLAEEQMVTFAENPRHRRAKLIVITEKGRTSLAAVVMRHAHWVNKIACGIDPDAIADTTAMLATLLQRIERDQTNETDRIVLRTKERQR